MPSKQAAGGSNPLSRCNSSQDQTPLDHRAPLRQNLVSGDPADTAELDRRVASTLEVQAEKAEQRDEKGL
jgi:hypothetical protein